MARNTRFNPEREPLRDDSTLQLIEDKIHGPFAFLNPTQAHFNHVLAAKSSADSGTSRAAGVEGRAEDLNAAQETPVANVQYKWTSRNNRKGRHAIVVQPIEPEKAQYATPPATSGVKQVLRGISLMVTYYPIWDVSYLVAAVFTLGSVVWVINAFFALLPFTNPASEFPGEVLYGGGITAFIGATIFEIGSVLLMIEAVNENRAGCFGWALKQVYSEYFGGNGEERAVTQVVPDAKGCTHHHGNCKNLVGKPPQQNIETASGVKNEKAGGADPTPEGSGGFVWFPSWYELRTHYLHDLGFLACSAQMFGATVFWISGLTALPPIYSAIEPYPAKLNGAYWIPQIIGGSGFVISGTLFMIETQKHWWQPAPKVLGWHIGLWNLIGGIGFTIWYASRDLLSKFKTDLSQSDLWFGHGVLEGVPG